VILKKRFKIQPAILVAGFFAAFLATGLMIFKDYGVHWDENKNQALGLRWAHYAAGVLETRSLSVPLPAYPIHDLIHGPAFEVFMAAAGEFLKLRDPQDILWMRHLSVFLFFFAGVSFFYFLCRRIFQSWRLALLGCVFLVFSPRIFADAFYNSVDIPFLTVFVVGLLTLLRLLDERTVRSAGVHGLVCAFLVNIRFTGIFLTVLTVLFFSWEILRVRSPGNRRQAAVTFACYLLVFLGLGVAFNPFLWSAPWAHLQEVVRQALAFQFPRRFHFWGQDVVPQVFPWYYGPVWILVSTPLMYGILFFAGLFFAAKMLLESQMETSLTKRNIVLFLCCFFLPLIMATGKLYNGWRHLYFIYPVFLIFAVLGARGFWRNAGPGIRATFLGGMVLCLGGTAFFMILNHPFQNLYFNRLAGADAGEITRRFELDYWGLSYRRALEYVLRTDRDPVIPIFFPGDYPWQNNLGTLPPKARGRFAYAPEPKAKYFLVHEMSKPFPYSGEECYSILVNGVKILAVYKLDHRRKR